MVLSCTHSPTFVKGSLLKGSLLEHTQRDGIVQEATKVAFEDLYNVVFPDSLRYCKNCKMNEAALDFNQKHWHLCVHSTRWCTHCDVSVPLPLWQSHAERHTMVLCFDCHKVLQWRQWDNHRTHCPGMLKEISPDNPFLSEETRSLSPLDYCKGGAKRRDGPVRNVRVQGEIFFFI